MWSYMSPLIPSNSLFSKPFVLLAFSQNLFQELFTGHPHMGFRAVFLYFFFFILVWNWGPRTGWFYHYTIVLVTSGFPTEKSFWKKKKTLGGYSTAQFYRTVYKHSSQHQPRVGAFRLVFWAIGFVYALFSFGGTPVPFITSRLHFDCRYKYTITIYIHRFVTFYSFFFLVIIKGCCFFWH